MGTTSSNRVILPLECPEVLEVDKIWNEWLPRYISKEVYENLNQDKNAKISLKLLFSLASSIPRAIQFIITEAQKTFKNSSVVNATIIDELYKNAMYEINAYYGKISVITVSLSHARAILFEENIAVDEYITQMISNSLLINSIKVFNNDPPAISNIVPKTSILSIKIFTKDKFDIHWAKLQLALNTFDDLCVENPDVSKFGNFLQIAMRSLIEARYHVLIKLASDDKKVTTVKISDLFLLKNLSNIKGGIKGLNLYTEFIVPKYGEGEVDVTLPNSYTMTNEFINESNVAAEDNQIINYCLNPFECFDYCMLLKSENGKPFAIFVDAKSKLPSDDLKLSNNSDSKTSYKLADMPKKVKQYQQVLNIVGEAKRFDQKINNGSLLEALRNENFIYIYLNTDQNSQSFTITDDRKVMQIGGEDSKRFLSFFYNSYRLVRFSVASQLSNEK
jgi:hypothetical protein